ncbi:c-type cytochrome [Bacillus shivajii]|uniref:c-type cytochrome n=1 Tax=Bacillus shivajii TaxID=1983719 RepID=UPI001CF97043|nr:c-type cytochrome [Bacillus shivajii]UCZ52659.1 c-type cytochrome [Bacillus shivajii]
MKKLLAATLGAVLVLGACGGADEPAPEEPADDTGTEETAGDATYDAANGESVYQQSCVACHGGNLEGASGPGLEGLTYDAVMTAIEEGPGTMPAGLVEGQDAEDVSAWIADQ